MEKMATADYDFGRLLLGGGVFVDKTDMLWKLGVLSGT